jgi:Skp family chaperone for outer membrane proteins
MNAIYAFVREYNEANQKFDVILTKQATLYINSGMDITNEIVEGLNAEYKKVKSKE